ncbi:hypothetical protein LEMLEM_LOCUS20303, partial [Lemmus lemmus]
MGNYTGMQLRRRSQRGLPSAGGQHLWELKNMLEIIQRVGVSDKGSPGAG